MFIFQLLMTKMVRCGESRATRLHERLFTYMQVFAEMREFTPFLTTLLLLVFVLHRPSAQHSHLTTRYLLHSSKCAAFGPQQSPHIVELNTRKYSPAIQHNSVIDMEK